MKKLFYSFVYWGIMCSRFWGGKSLVLVFVVAHSHAIILIAEQHLMKMKIRYNSTTEPYPPFFFFERKKKKKCFVDNTKIKTLMTKEMRSLQEKNTRVENGFFITPCSPKALSDCGKMIHLL